MTASSENIPIVEDSVGTCPYLRAISIIMSKYLRGIYVGQSRAPPGLFWADLDNLAFYAKSEKRQRESVVALLDASRKCHSVLSQEENKLCYTTIHSWKLKNIDGGEEL